MATQRVERGDIADRVAQQVKALREERRLTLAQLSERLTEVGRPILPTGIKKIERGGELARRVDVDDLVGLALALGVTPNRLLFGGDAGPDPLPLTTTVAPSSRDVWEWASGQSGEGLVEAGVDVDEKASRPHRPPVDEKRMHQIRDDLGPVFEALEEAHAAGVTLDELQHITDLHLNVERSAERKGD
jgi:transcriptional regulator with XRE-family HTH domain